MPKKKAARKPETTAAPVKDEVVEMVTKDFDQSWEYCKGSWHDRWQNNFKLYHNMRVKRGYDGITDTFVPMVFSTIETLTSGLFGSKPKFNFLPPHEKKDQDTDILNALLDFYWDKDQWSIKVIDTGREMLQLGTSVDYFYWNGDHPCMIHIPLRDFFIDPNATSIENAQYMGRRYLTTIEELESFEIVDWENPIETPPQPVLDEETGEPVPGEPAMDEMGEPLIDPATGEPVPGAPMMSEPEMTYAMKKKYKNLDKLKKPDEGGEGAPADEKTDKQEKDDLYGSTLPDGTDNGQVEVIEYWTRDKTISIVNRRVVIEDTENYYKAKDKANGAEYPSGLMPFACSRDYVDPSLFYAMGEIDFISDQQELLNDLTNQRIDAVTYVLNPMYTLDPAYADKLEEVENLPGAVYPFPKDTLNRIDMGQVSPDAFNETMNIKSDIRETTASNEIVKGAAQEGGKTTATEINAQIAGAGQRINLKVTQIENEYFHRVARIVFGMVKLYVTEPMMVRIVGKDGAKWEEFDPSEYQGDYEPRAQLDIAIQNKKQEQAAQAKELLGAFLNDPQVNQQELKKLVLARSFELEPDEVELLMQPDPAQAMMGGMPGAMGPAGVPGMEGMPQAGGQPGQSPMPPEDDHAKPSIGGAAQQSAPAPGVPDASNPEHMNNLPPDVMAELQAMGAV